MMTSFRSPLHELTVQELEIGDLSHRVTCIKGVDTGGALGA